MLIESWRPSEDLPLLAELLHSTVLAGASIGFVFPFSLSDAEAFWRQTVHADSNRHVLIARDGARILGTVQLALAPQPNQTHRADVLKLLVHPTARNQGVGRALMLAIEPLARAHCRTLLTLDTRTGDTGERLYRALGYQCVGTIPGYSLAVDSPELEAATFFYKVLTNA